MDQYDKTVAAEVARRYRSGNESLRAIVADLRSRGIPMTHESACVLLERQGVHLRQKNAVRSIVIADMERLLERYMKGESLEDLAEEVGCSPLTLATRLNEAKRELVKYLKENPRVLSRAIVHLYRDEVQSMQRVTTTLGQYGVRISPSHVRKVLVEAGVPRRVPGRVPDQKQQVEAWKGGGNEAGVASVRDRQCSEHRNG